VFGIAKHLIKLVNSLIYCKVEFNIGGFDGLGESLYSFCRIRCLLINIVNRFQQL
jgi:hypothetical protein